MTISEAVKSGKPFKHGSWHDRNGNYLTYKDGMFTMVSGESYSIPYELFISDKWEIVKEKHKVVVDDVRWDSTSSNSAVFPIKCFRWEDFIGKVTKLTIEWED